MFNTIFVATDLSAASDALIDGLALLRSLGAETAVLCHALGIHGHETLYPMLARFVEPRIRQQQERLERLGFKVAVEIAPGVPALEIHRVATERGAGLIAVGSRGATLAREILLGGTATEVLHQARVPVLLVRIVMTAEGEEGACQPSVTSILRGVLYPTDCSKATMSAFSCVDEMVACTSGPRSLGRCNTDGCSSGPGRGKAGAVVIDRQGIIRKIHTGFNPDMESVLGLKELASAGTAGGK